MKKQIKIFASVLLWVLLCSCSINFSDVNQLMSPPKPTGSRQQIQEIIYREAGNDIQYSYPKNGNYRSAIIEEEDITGDGRTDVLGFYETPDNSGGVTFIILSEVDEETAPDAEVKWEIIAKYESVYTHVDRVNFGDLDGDGVKEVIVGWGSPVNQRGNICTYNYYENMIWELNLGVSYTEMVINDFMKSEVGDEMIVMELSKIEEKDDGTVEEFPAMARLYRINGERYVKYSEINIDKTFVRYASVSAGMIDQGTNAVITDGVKADNSVQTEIVYWSDGASSLIVYPPVEDPSGESPTLRSAAANVYARDLNKDGFYEIPTVSLFPGVDEDEAVQANYCISWNRYSVSNQEYLLVMDTVMNSEYNYYLELPEKWRDKVTVKNSDSALFVYEWDLREQKAKDLLLKIEVYPKESYQEKPIVLEEQGGYIYAAEIPEQYNVLSITETQLRESFHLLS